MSKFLYFILTLCCASCAPISPYLLETLGEIPEGLTKEEFLEYRNNEKKEFLKNGDYFQLKSSELKGIYWDYYYFRQSYFEKSRKEEIMLKLKALSELKPRSTFPPKYKEYYGQNFYSLASRKRQDSISKIQGELLDELYGLNHFYDLHAIDYMLYKKKCKCFRPVDRVAD